SWALLKGFRLAGKRAFAPAGSISLIRKGDDGPQVPLPLARAISLRAGIVGGPNETTSGSHYAYATENLEVQRWLLGWLNGAYVSEQLTRRFAWLRAATSSPGHNTIAIPTDIR